MLTAPLPRDLSAPQAQSLLERRRTDHAALSERSCEEERRCVRRVLISFSKWASPKVEFDVCFFLLPISGSCAELSCRHINNTAIYIFSTFFYSRVFPQCSICRHAQVDYIGSAWFSHAGRALCGVFFLLPGLPAASSPAPHAGGGPSLPQQVWSVTEARGTHHSLLVPVYNDLVGVSDRCFFCVKFLAK